MTSSSRLPIGDLDAALDQILSVDPIYLTTGEKQAAMIGLSRARARVEAAVMRVLAVADDVADDAGARSAAAWLSTQTRDAPGAVRRHATLATALTTRWAGVSDALAAGEVNLAQTRVIVEALDDLPAGVGEDLRAKAESYLVENAAVLGPRELRILGARVLDHLAPGVADEHEYELLLAQERRADATTRLSMRPRGDGSTDLHARIPDHAAHRLLVYLDAYTSPRRQHLLPDAGADRDEVARLPIARQRGQAFVTLLEHVPTASLPRHGGSPTTVTVTLDYDTLVADATAAGVVTTSAGDRLTAGQARRLACQAGILPVVLGAKSEILDVGRTRRLVSGAIRKALNLRDRGCTEAGCTMPAAYAEAHHVVPWSRGGKTSLQDCKLLCSFHHHRAHDPAWVTHHQVNGTTTFTRRQ